MSAASEHYGRLADDARGRLATMPPPQRSAASRVQMLRRRLAAANVAADEAIDAYTTRQARLRRQFSDPVAYQLRARDDQELAELSASAAFHTTLATRLAATITAEVLTELLVQP